MKTRAELFERLRVLGEEEAEIVALLAERESAVDDDEQTKPVKRSPPEPVEPEPVTSNGVLVAPITIDAQGRIHVEWADGAPKQHSVWVTIRAGEMDGTEPASQWPSAADSTHVVGASKYLSKPISSGKRTVEIATIATDANGKAVWVPKGVTRQFIAVTVPVSQKGIVSGTTSGSPFNGIGVPTSSKDLDPSLFSATKINRLKGVRNKKFKRFKIDIKTGNIKPFYFQGSSKEPEYAVLHFDDCHNIDLSEFWIRAPRDGNWNPTYGKGYSFGIYINGNCSNITAHGCNIIGFFDGFKSNGAMGTHVSEAIFGRYTHGACTYSHVRESSARVAVMRNIYGYVNEPDGLTTNIDNFGWYLPIIPGGGRKHQYHNIMCEGGGYKYGSACPFGDGGDWVVGAKRLDAGGVHGKNLTALDTHNKTFAISGGSESLLEDIVCYQHEQSPGVKWSSGHVASYMAHYGSDANKKVSRPRHFRNNLIRNVRSYFCTEKNGVIAPRGMALPPHTDQHWAFGTPPSNPNYANNRFEECNWNDTSLTRAIARQHGIDAFDKPIPAYDIPGESEEYWISATP